MIRAPFVPLLAVVMLGAGSGAALALTPECARFGSPSYSADRTLTVGGRTFSSKVHVSGGREREEARTGDQIEVRIVTRAGFVAFNPDKKVGIRRSAPPPPGRAQPGSFRTAISDEGGTKIVRTEGRREDGGWDLIAEARCRADGVPLSRRFFAPIGGQLVESRLSQSNIVVGPQPAALFQVPKDVKFVR